MLKFIIDSNLSFNTVNSDSFKGLLSYFNQYVYSFYYFYYFQFISYVFY